MGLRVIRWAMLYELLRPRRVPKRPSAEGSQRAGCTEAGAAY
jgi:hypothetical protein